MTITRRKLIRTIGAAGTTFGVGRYIINRAHAQSQTLYVNSYGGVLQDSWVKAFFAPFTAKTGIQVKPVPPVSYAKLRAQVQSKSFEWDMQNLGEVEFAQAEYDGLLDKIDTSIIIPNSLPDGMVRGNGVASYTLSTNLVYRKDKFPNGGPKSWADFWNVRKFPGNRCLFDRPFTCLAFALLADGVSVDKIYPMDIDRAFRKMDEIKPHIKVWWTQGSQSQQLIRDGEVDMIGMWSARTIELIEQGVPLELVWNGAENYSSVWCVAKGTPKAKIAWQYIEFATQPQQQAEFTKLLPYGPSNPNALPLIPEQRSRQTPSWPDNLKASFKHDEKWMAPRLGEIRERWTQWRVS